MVLAIGIEVSIGSPAVCTAGGGGEAWEVASEVLTGIGIDPDGEEGGEAADDVSRAVSSSIRCSRGDCNA